MMDSVLHHMQRCKMDVADWLVNSIHVVCMAVKKITLGNSRCVGLERID
jgi:hypothetical protein